MDNLESRQHYNDGSPYTNPTDHPAERKYSMDIIGNDLNSGRGFLSFDEVKGTWDMDNPPYGSIFRINNKNYRVIKYKNEPILDFWDN